MSKYCRYTVVIDKSKDPDLVELIDNAQNKSALLLLALRDFAAGTDRSILRGIEELKSMLKRGVEAEIPADSGEEISALAENFDSIVGRFK
jgi:hypothetical protein